MEVNNFLSPKANQRMRSGTPRESELATAAGLMVANVRHDVLQLHTPHRLAKNVRDGANRNHAVIPYRALKNATPVLLERSFHRLACPQHKRHGELIES